MPIHNPIYSSVSPLELSSPLDKATQSGSQECTQRWQLVDQQSRGCERETVVLLLAKERPMRPATDEGHRLYAPV